MVCTVTWWTASARLRAITMTRSSTVSSSSARGSVVTVTSAAGLSARTTLDDAVLERGDAVERQRAADRDDQVDEQHLAHLPHAQPIDGDDAGEALNGRRDLGGGAGRRSIGEGVDGAPAEPPAGDADEHRDDDRGSRVRPGIAERDGG